MVEGTPAPEREAAAIEQAEKGEAAWRESLATADQVLDRLESDFSKTGEKLDYTSEASWLKFGIYVRDNGPKNTDELAQVARSVGVSIESVNEGGDLERALARVLALRYQHQVMTESGLISEDQIKLADDVLRGIYITHPGDRKPLQTEEAQKLQKKFKQLRTSLGEETYSQLAELTHFATSSLKRFYTLVPYKLFRGSELLRQIKVAEKGGTRTLEGSSHTASEFTDPESHHFIRLPQDPFRAEFSLAYLRELAKDYPENPGYARSLFENIEGRGAGNFGDLPAPDGAPYKERLKALRDGPSILNYLGHDGVKLALPTTNTPGIMGGWGPKSLLSD